MKPWQWKSCHDSSGFAKKNMDSFVPFLHHFNHLQTHHLVLLPCIPRTQPVFQPDVPYKSGNLQMSACPLNLHHIWIIIVAPSAAAATITLICPGETTQFIEVRKPIYILHLPTACSSTSPNFHLPPQYEDHH